MKKVQDMTIEEKKDAEAEVNLEFNDIMAGVLDALLIGPFTLEARRKVAKSVFAFIDQEYGYRLVHHTRCGFPPPFNPIPRWTIKEYVAFRRWWNDPRSWERKRKAAQRELAEKKAAQGT